VRRPYDVRFRHPAYPESEPELLRLNAVDGPGDDGDGRRDGIDYDTAFIACCIVAGNTWGGGWLVERTAEGSFSRMQRPPDGILRGQVYYFLLGDHGPECRHFKLLQLHEADPRADSDGFRLQTSIRSTHPSIIGDSPMVIFPFHGLLSKSHRFHLLARRSKRLLLPSGMKLAACRGIVMPLSAPTLCRCLLDNGIPPML
jgi:hypothetical protein